MISWGTLFPDRPKGVSRDPYIHWSFWTSALVMLHVVHAMPNFGNYCVSLNSVGMHQTHLNCPEVWANICTYLHFSNLEKNTPCSSLPDGFQSSFRINPASQWSTGRAICYRAIDILCIKLSRGREFDWNFQPPKSFIMCTQGPAYPVIGWDSTRWYTTCKIMYQKYVPVASFGYEIDEIVGSLIISK